MNDETAGQHHPFDLARLARYDTVNLTPATILVKLWN